LRKDIDIATTLEVGLEALLLEPVAQGDVLGVAELGGAQLLALEVCRTLDRGVDDQRGAAGGRAGDDGEGLTPGVDERVDGRAGADVRGVDGAGLQCLHGCGSRVERRDREPGRPEVSGEEALLVRDDRRGMGEVGKVPEAHLLRSNPGGPRVTATGRHAQGRDDGADRQGYSCEGSVLGELRPRNAGLRRWVSRTAAGALARPKSAQTNSYVTGRSLL